jgi:hypothetical protein
MRVPGGLVSPQTGGITPTYQPPAPEEGLFARAIRGITGAPAPAPPAEIMPRPATPEEQAIQAQREYLRQYATGQLGLINRYGPEQLAAWKEGIELPPAKKEEAQMRQSAEIAKWTLEQQQRQSDALDRIKARFKFNLGTKFGKMDERGKVRPLTGEESDFYANVFARGGAQPEDVTEESATNLGLVPLSKPTAVDQKTQLAGEFSPFYGKSVSDLPPDLAKKRGPAEAVGAIKVGPDDRIHGPSWTYTEEKGFATKEEAMQQALQMYKMIPDKDRAALIPSVELGAGNKYIPKLIPDITQRIPASVPTATPGISYDRRKESWVETLPDGTKRTLSSREVRETKLDFLESQPTSDIRTMQQATPSVLELVKKSRENLAVAEKRYGVGPLQSRWRDFWSGKIGTADPEFRALKTTMGLLTTRLMRMHVGARGGEYMMKHFGDMLATAKDHPDNLRAVLDEIENYAKEIRDTRIPKAVMSPEGKPTSSQKKSGTKKIIVYDSKGNRIEEREE